MEIGVTDKNNCKNETANIPLNAFTVFQEHIFICINILPKPCEIDNIIPVEVGEISLGGYIFFG